MPVERTTFRLLSTCWEGFHGDRHRPHMQGVDNCETVTDAMMSTLAGAWGRPCTIDLVGPNTGPRTTHFGFLASLVQESD